MKKIFDRLTFLKNPVVLRIVVVVLVAMAGVVFWWWKQNSNPPSSENNQSVESEVDEAYAILQVIKGEVELEKEGERINLSAPVEIELFGEEVINTKKETVASIDYGDGTVVRLSEDTEVTYQLPADEKTGISQKLGLMYVRFKKILGVKEEFEVETPTVAAAVRGTSFMSEIDDEETTYIIVFEGQVFVSQRDSEGNLVEGSTVEVGQGFQATVKKIQPDLPIEPEKAVVVETQTLTPRQQKWLEFNKEADKLLEKEDRNLNDLVHLVSGFSIFQTPTPSSTTEFSPTPTLTPTVASINDMPGYGYHTATVTTEVGSFPLSCYGASQGVRVITDSANENDCHNDCPVAPLDEYATRNNGVAAMNGMYFCPADYADCAGKVNTFDTLLFNSRVKRYINSENNVYSTLPFLVINSDGSPRFVSRTLEWGRDSGIQAGIAGNPMLIHGKNLVANSDSLDAKQRDVKSNRGAFVQKGNTLYLCIVGGATVMDSAYVYKTLEVDNAINIDGGGSSALWVQGGYKYGPGREIPSAIIFAL